MEGLLLCPFLVKNMPPASGVLLSLQAKQDLFPPYRLLIHGVNVRGVLLIRSLTMKGQPASLAGHASWEAGEPAYPGEMFGEQLLPFWAPECSVGGMVELQVENESCMSLRVAAVLIAASMSVEQQEQKAQEGLAASILKPAGSYWR